MGIDAGGGGVGGGGDGVVGSALAEPEPPVVLYSDGVSVRGTRPTVPPSHFFSLVYRDSAERFCTPNTKKACSLTVDTKSRDC